MRDRVRHRGGPPGIFLGLLIVALGVIFLLDQQGIFPARVAFHFFWAAVMIFWGVEILVSVRHGNAQIGGAVLILLGTVFLANELGYVHFRIAALWPLILIGLGGWILLKRLGTGYQGGPSEGRDWHDRHEWRDWGEKFRASVHRAGGQPAPGPSVEGPQDSDSEFNQTAIFSGFKRRVRSQHFKYAKIATVFGGFNIDFTRADMDGGRAEIQIESVFGGGEIRVPDTWIVKLETGAIGGAFVDETYPRPVDASAPVKQLIVRGTVVFGGVVIKN